MNGLRLSPPKQSGLAFTSDGPEATQWRSSFILFAFLLLGIAIVSQLIYTQSPSASLAQIPAALTEDQWAGMQEAIRRADYYPTWHEPCLSRAQPGQRLASQLPGRRPPGSSHAWG